MSQPSQTRTLLVALLLAVVAMPPSTIAYAQEPYVIDALLPLTGSSAFSGQTHADALKVYETVVNAEGGIHGRPIHFEIHDDQSSPLVAVQTVNQLLARHPVVILGSTSIASCSAEAPVMPVSTVEFCLSPGLLPHQANVFASSASIAYLTDTLIKLYRERGYTQIGLISTTDATGQAARQHVFDALKEPINAALRISADERFNATDLNIAAQVARIRTAGPQGLLVFATGNAFGTVLHSLHDGGVDLPVLTSAVNMNEHQLSQYDAFLPKELIFNSVLYVAPDQVKNSAVKVAINEFYHAYQLANILPSPESGLSWDPAKIVVAALRALPLNATGEQLAAYIDALHGFAGVSGLYDFRTGDHHGLTDSALVFVKWVPSTRGFVAVSKPGGDPIAPAK